MIARNIFPELEKHLPNKLITVINGLRRVGKTTAVKYLLSKSKTSNKAFFDLERVEYRHLFNQQSYKQIQESILVEGVDITKPGIIAIDEIQMVPQITSVIKYFYDNYPIKFIVTGSSSFYLKNQFTESLAGRKRIFELHPLSFGEYIKFKQIKFNSEKFKPFDPVNITFYNKLKKNYDDYVHWGGLPEVVLSETNDDRIAYLKDIINSYIELDVRLLSDFSKSDELYKIIRLLVSRVGSRIDYSKLSSITGLHRHKLKDYLHLLENTYFIHTAAPFTKSADKEISLQRKMYFSDTGVLTLFGGVSSGSIFENAVANQLRQYGKLNYYAKKTGHEIDFILDEKTAIEIKETPTVSDLNILNARTKAVGLKKQYLIGKHLPSSQFADFIWGGSIF